MFVLMYVLEQCSVIENIDQNSILNFINDIKEYHFINKKEKELYAVLRFQKS